MFNVLNKFRGKMLVCLILLAALAYPTAISANDGDTAAFIFFEASATTITAGQSVTFTIQTSGSNAVFATVGGSNISATPRAGGSPESTWWDLTVNPAATQLIVVQANAPGGAESASVRIPVTVGGAVATQPTTPQAPAAQAGAHRIYSVTEVEAPYQNSVKLEIVADAGSNFLWVRLPDGRYMRGNRTGSSGTQSTWEVVYRPQPYSAHQIQVFSNGADHRPVVDNTINQQINLTAPFVRPVTPTITRASASPSTIEPGARTTITVRTNADVEYVWAMVDGRRVNSRRGSTGTTTRTWTIDVRPDETQTIRVYANTTDSTSGADTDTVRVTVRDAEPRILATPTLSHNNIRPGDRTTIEVRTNEVVTHVWAMLDGRRINAQRETTSSGERRWSIDISPERSHNVFVYANTSSGTSGADRRTIRVDVSW